MSVMRFVSRLADWRVKIASGMIGGIIIVGALAGYWLGVIDGSTAGMTVIGTIGLMNTILNLNVGHSEYVIAKLQERNIEALEGGGTA